MSIFGGLFWGVFLLAAGLIIMLKLVLNLQVSAGRLIFGLFIILIGVSLLFGSPGWGTWNIHENSTNLFSGGQTIKITDSTDRDFSTVFGNATYDASGMQPGDHVKINCAFGSCRVLLPAGKVYVTATCAFGSVHLPDGNNFSFNSSSWGTDSSDAVRVEISCAFGSVNMPAND
jgi:hypothetical protein